MSYEDLTTDEARAIAIIMSEVGLQCRFPTRGAGASDKRIAMALKVLGIPEHDIEILIKEG